MSSGGASSGLSILPSAAFHIPSPKDEVLAVQAEILEPEAPRATKRGQVTALSPRQPLKRLPPPPLCNQRWHPIPTPVTISPPAQPSTASKQVPKFQQPGPVPMQVREASLLRPLTATWSELLPEGPSLTRAHLPLCSQSLGLCSPTAQPGPRNHLSRKSQGPGLGQSRQRMRNGCAFLTQRLVSNRISGADGWDAVSRTTLSQPALDR